VVGFVPFRPLGQSHFIPAPWQVSADTAYLPTVMSEEALRKGIQKAREDLPEQISDERYERVFNYMYMRLSKLWAGNNLMSYEEAVGRLNLDKSPGFPFYYECDDKACALTCKGHVIKKAVEDVMSGKEMWLPSTLTLKDELRSADRVRDGKTRVFSASSMVALIASKMLFDKQNDKLREHLDEHPLTIGIQVPGPHFVKRVLTLSRQCNCTASDLSGCDQRYVLWAARLVRDCRKIGIPPEYHAAIDLLYDEDFAGDVICMGCVYKMYHNKSGRNNTGDDNGLMQWAVTADYVLETEKCEISEVDNFWEGMFNGDDGLTAWWGDCSGVGWRDHLKQFNTIVELETEEPKHSEELTFLSHHLKERNVSGLGDIIIAAGNRTKLLSSREWLRRNADFSVEENALAHLLGLRIALWPWRADFVDVEELIDQYVDTIETTPSIRDILKARIPEQQIINLHVRFEDGLPFFPESDALPCRVRDLIISAIFQCVDAMSNNKAKEMARRLAQSKKDKAASKKMQSKGKGKTEKVNSGVAKEHRTSAPAAMAFDNANKFAVGRSSRFKDGIVVETSDHLEYVVDPGNAVVGQVLNEIYLNPQELGGTRLAAYANLYEKYLIEVMALEYVPSVGSDQPGALVLAFDRDISDPTPPPTEEGVRQFTAYEGSVDGNVWTKKVCKAKLIQPDSGYYTNAVAGGDDRLSYQGQAYVALTVPTGNVSQKTLGRLRLHTKIHFFTPQLQSSVQGATGRGVYGLGSSYLPAQNVDVFGALQNWSIPTWDGVQQWKPILDSLGKWYVNLQPGIYRLSEYLNMLSNTGILPTAGTVDTGPIEFDPPSMVMNEPMPVSAPQPWIEEENISTWFPNSVGSTNAAGSVAADYLLGVPRGGAKLYSTVDIGSDFPTQVNKFLEMLTKLDRISGYIPTGSTLFGARWVGAQECATPKNFKTTARARSKKLKLPTQVAKPAASPAIPSRNVVAAFNVVKAEETTKGLDEKQARTLDQLEKLFRSGIKPEDIIKSLFRTPAEEARAEQAMRAFKEKQPEDQPWMGEV